ncbi:C40 family peptidase [Cloacibacterium sp.]|uniref:C40 family peptidase n=1 Tax=Cloacibacterium sp. TaxID=1913682 RepID=UPI0035B0EDD9
MKKRVLLYTIAVMSVFSLQSCVTNYVVSTPTKYKSDANLEKLNTKNLNAANKSTYNSYNVNFANVQKSELAAAITSAISLDKTIDDVLNEASTYIGTPYRFGGTNRSGIDCSAFVLNVFGESTGIELPRVAAEQAELGDKVEKQELQKGDLVFFSQGGRVSHVGIVQEVTPEGEIKFIHAATSRGVMISSLNDSYWGRKFRFAKRIIKQQPQQ